MCRKLLTNPQKPVILSGWERGKRNLHRLAKLANYKFCTYLAASSRVRCYISYLDYTLKFCTCMHASVILVLSFCTCFGAGEVDPPITSVGFFPHFGQSVLLCYLFIPVYLELICANPLTNPNRPFIIYPYLGEHNGKSKETP